MKPQNSQQKLIVILGPTSSGKTGLAQELCRQFNGFIVSADSRQVYRYMDIGTGKIESLSELKDLRRQRQKLLKRLALDASNYIINLGGADYYMLDIIDPTEHYNAALYQRDVFSVLKPETPCHADMAWRNPKPETNPNDQNSKFQIPFLVGGTGLYIDAVVDNWRFPPGEPDLELREQIERQIETDGIESVWAKLIGLDPESKEFVQKENPRRVARALEYVMSTGQKFSKNRGRGRRQFKVLKIGIDLPREELYKKIDARVDARLKIGMIKEVEELVSKHKVSFERLRQFGLEYRVVADYLQGKFDSVDSMSQRLKWNIHGYARRQLTWFRRDKEIKWVSNYKEAKKLVEEFLNNVF